MKDIMSSNLIEDTEASLMMSGQPNQPSEIREYFKGSKIFLTGATGFIGKLLIEKLLRSCPDVDQIFVLIRPKKGKDVTTRVRELLECVVFEKLKKESPKVFEKISAVNGDCSQPDLGLSEEFRNTLRSEVNCVIHCAATVRFDEPMPSAVNINVRSTRDLINLAKTMEKLEVLVYVSTAYCFCPRTTIEEKFYAPPISAEKLITISESLNETTLKKVTPNVLGEWPNTYTFTKAVAEGIAKDAAEELPLAIIRPSIVIGTAKEPLEGWIDNMYGSTGVVIGAYTGLMRSLHCDPEKLADMVPADFVANQTLAVAWKVGRHRKDKLTKNTHISKIKNDTSINECSESKVFNCVSSVDNPITWNRFMKILENWGRKNPTSSQVWYYWFTINRNYFVHFLFRLFFQTLPAYFVDLFFICIGQKPKMVKIYQKIDKFSNVLSYFCTRQWTFTNSNSKNLWKEMNDEDKKLFPFLMNEYKWENLLVSVMKGGRIYLLNDPMETLSESRKKFFKLRIAHYIVTGLAVLLLFKILSMIMNIIM